jgi:Carboxypeptidase regulatory-like domain
MGSKVQISFFLSMVVAVSGWPQSTTASLLGVVRDKTGAAIPEAQVTAQNVLTSFTRATFTDDSGAYLIPNLPVGEYTLSAQKPGDHGLMLRNAIEWAANEAPPVKVTGLTVPSILDSEVIAIDLA